MLLITYGMPRSASTFIWQLTYDIINYTNKQHEFKQLLEPHQRPNFIYDISKEIDSISTAIPDDAFYLIKTHGEYSEALRPFETRNELKIICSIRNPYDLCVSWMDVHQKEMKEGKPRPGFEEANTLEKVVEVVKRDISIAEEWLGAENPLVFKYEEITGDHGHLIDSIVNHIGIETYLYDKVYNFYLDKANITEFNKGVSGRGEELKSRLDEDTKKIFDTFIDRYLS